MVSYGRIQGRSQDFSKGGHTESNIIVMAFSPRNIVGCFLTKGGSRASQDPPRYTLGIFPNLVPREKRPGDEVVFSLCLLFFTKSFVFVSYRFLLWPVCRPSEPETCTCK